MDKTRIFILVTGLVMIVGFSLYTFMGSSPSSPKPGTKIQPVKKLSLSVATQNISSSHDQAMLPTSNATTKSTMISAIPSFFYVVSLVPTTNDSSVAHNTTSQVLSSQNVAKDSNASLDSYENRDVPENYYSIGFPSGANIIQGVNPGSYIATINPYSYSIELQDIPDDSNVQLYTLTHAEPSLRTSLAGYKLISSGELTVGKTRAWDLVYTWKNSTQDLETIKVFIEG